MSLFVDSDQEAERLVGEGIDDVVAELDHHLHGLNVLAVETEGRGGIDRTQEFLFQNVTVKSQNELVSLQHLHFKPVGNFQRDIKGNSKVFIITTREIPEKKSSN